MDFDTLWDERPWWPFESTSKERAQYYFNKGVESVVANTERLNQEVEHGQAGECDSKNCHLAGIGYCSELCRFYPPAG